jgi:hypothetical protein
MPSISDVFYWFEPIRRNAECLAAPTKRETGFGGGKRGLDMAEAPFRGRTTTLLAALAIAGVSVGLGPAAPAFAGPAAPPAAHGMGAARSVSALVTPAAGLRSLATLAAPAVTLPATVNLTRYAERVGDQGAVNSCTAWAIGYAMMGWFARSQGHAGIPYAPMYAYSQVNGGRDEGSSPIDVLEVIRTQGIDTAADYARKHTQSTLDWRHKPSAIERTNAAANKITGWVTLYNTSSAPGAVGIDAVKRTLASGRPVALGIEVYSRFMSAHGAGAPVSSSGKLGALEGYHEVLALGYNGRGVVIENSWGVGWGDHGYATLDWNYVARHSFEAETISGLATTTGVNRPVVTTVTAGVGAAASVITVTGSKLTSAMVTLGTITFAPIAIAANGRTLTFKLPAGAAASSALRLSTPGGISAARTYSYRR